VTDAPVSRGLRALLLGLWLLLLAAGALFVQQKLAVGGDLRLFMPSPRTDAQRLLMTELGEGPASRLLLVAIEGAPTEALAESSKALVAGLRESGQFAAIANGAQDAAAVPDRLLPYRYLLTDRFDAAPLDATRLHDELQARVQDLGSPAGAVLEVWIPRDPTLETLAVAEKWQPSHEPQRIDDVWFDRAAKRALLVLETNAAAFDPDTQRAALTAIDDTFAKVRTDPRATLVVSGPGAFSVLMRAKTEREASWIGTVDSVAMIVLLLLAYRSLGLTALAALPLASAGVAGMAAVTAWYGTVHGITLAFGFTLIGVVQDYPVHLLSHRHPGESPLATARALWAPLGTGIASTCIAYLSFLFSGVPGLAQLAVFTITGLAVAGLSTRYVLPRLVGVPRRDVGDSRWLADLSTRIARLPRPSWLAPLLGVASLGAIVAMPGPFWDDQLGNLTPVPVELLQKDAALRAELGTPDLRHLVVVEGRDAADALARSASLARRLDGLVANGALQGYDSASRYLPTPDVQLRRRDALPDRATLARDLDAALKGLPFRAGVFEPFLADVEAARSLPPLDAAALKGTPLDARISSLLRERAGGAVALFTLTGVRELGAVQAAVDAAGTGVTLLDLKGATESLVASQRTHIVRSLLVAVAVLVVVIWIALRRGERVYRVLLPMTLTTLLILAAFRVAGVPLNLFHLISLVLAAGLGLDYALFFERAGDDEADHRRTLHALLVCSAATLLVFFILALSSIPVLRAIGTTVTLGVVGNFVLGLLLARPGHAPSDVTERTA
jgi:predicted exporter